MQRAVFETAHHNLYRDAALWNRKLARERSNHQTGRVEGRRYFFTPARLMLIQMVEHPDANGEGAILFDNMRVEARETKTVRTLGKIHWLAPVKRPHAHEPEWREFGFLLKQPGCLPLQIAAPATKAETDA
jgi:hypothetical protein